MLNTEFEFMVDVQAGTRSQNRSEERSAEIRDSAQKGHAESAEVTRYDHDYLMLILTQCLSRATHHSKRVKRISSFILTALTFPIPVYTWQK